MSIASGIFQRQIDDKRRQMDHMLTACRGPRGEVREMTTEEGARFDALAGDVKTLKTRQASASEVEEPGDFETRARVGGGTRYNRVSDPIREDDPGGGPAIHTRQHEYSLLRAINSVVENRSVDGLEAEVSREIAIQTGVPAKGFYLPLHSLNVRERGPETRDLTTSTGAGAIFTRPEMPMIELLRSNTVIRQLGARFISDLQGNIGIPRQTSTTPLYWVAEGVPASPGTPGIDMVTLTPKIAIAMTVLSKMFIKQASVDAEQFAREDLTMSMAVGLDQAAINGGGGAAPTGILQNTAIQTNSAGLQGGSNGGPLTWAKIVAMESQVTGANVLARSLGYLMSPKLRGTLKTTQKGSNGYPIYLFDTVGEPSLGVVNGYPARSTALVPSNLVKGTSSNLSAIIFGAWEDLLVGQWGAVDVLVNPYTYQATGAVVISAEMAVDIKVRHDESFAIITDASVS